MDYSDEPLMGLPDARLVTRNNGGNYGFKVRIREGNNTSRVWLNRAGMRELRDELTEALKPREGDSVVSTKHYMGVHPGAPGVITEVGGKYPATPYAIRFDVGHKVIDVHMSEEMFEVQEEE